jgi:hypothetical protein
VPNSTLVPTYSNKLPAKARRGSKHRSTLLAITSGLCRHASGGDRLLRPRWLRLSPRDVDPGRVRKRGTSGNLDGSGNLLSLTSQADSSAYRRLSDRGSVSSLRCGSSSIRGLSAGYLTNAFIDHRKQGSNWNPCVASASNPGSPVSAPDRREQALAAPGAPHPGPLRAVEYLPQDGLATMRKLMRRWWPLWLILLIAINFVIFGIVSGWRTRIIERPASPAETSSGERP